QPNVGISGQPRNGLSQGLGSFDPLAITRSRNHADAAESKRRTRTDRLGYRLANIYAPLQGDSGPVRQRIGRMAWDRTNLHRGIGFPWCISKVWDGNRPWRRKHASMHGDRGDSL